MTATQHGSLLSVRNLQVSFPSERRIARVVDDVSFEVREAETLGIVGESGSGKSVTSLALMGLVPQPGTVTGGDVVFQDRELRKLDESQWRSIRGAQLGMIFQDPMTSLNPFLPVWVQIAEVTQLHLGYSRERARNHAIQMLEDVGIPDARARAGLYPHQFSGGMRQRVMIAMALACGPKLIIADEPTTALDVTIQAQILELLRRLKETRRTAMILITHDLGIVAENADNVLVMYAGRVMESATATEFFANPQNPYTRALLRCIPDLNAGDRELYQISGQAPDVSSLAPNQCPFAERCPDVIDRCRQEFPPYHQVGDGHWSLCWVR
jgi:oligopeptide transport system ATP-binding protein